MHDDEALRAADERYRAGHATWEEVQAEQDKTKLRCAPHGKLTHAVINGTPICETCVSEGISWVLRAQQLVRGGL